VGWGGFEDVGTEVEDEDVGVTLALVDGIVVVGGDVDGVVPDVTVVVGAGELDDPVPEPPVVVAAAAATAAFTSPTVPWRPKILASNHPACTRARHNARIDQSRS
jgi:hypothetical protein